MKSASNLKQWSLLPTNREVVYAVPEKHFSKIVTMSADHFFKSLGVACGELVDINDKSELLKKGNIIFILTLPAQNILATNFNARNSSTKKIETIYKNKNSFNAAEGIIKLISPQINSPASSINKGKHNEVIFCGMPSVNIYDDQFRTSYVYVKEIICAEAIDSNSMTRIKRMNPLANVYSANRVTLKRMSGQHKSDNWIHNPQCRFLFEITDPLHITDTTRACREQFMHYVPVSNMIKLPAKDQDDFYGINYCEERRAKLNEKPLLSRLTLDSHLTVIAHASSTTMGRVIDGKTHFIHRADVIADMLYYHGVRNVGVIYFYSCHFGRSELFAKLPGELIAKGINFSYLVGCHYQVNSERGEVTNNGILVPFKQAYHVINGNIPAGYSDFMYQPHTYF